MALTSGSKAASVRGSLGFGLMIELEKSFEADSYNFKRSVLRSLSAFKALGYSVENTLVRSLEKLLLKLFSFPSDCVSWYLPKVYPQLEGAS